MSVEIRSPFPDYALPRVWSWLEKVRNRVADDFGPKTVDEWVDQECGSHGVTWGVYRDGELGGMISFRQLSPWLGTAHCTFRKDFWGRATTRPAVESALKEMFSSGIGKLTLMVFSDNQAIRSLLSEFGAKVEGTMKRHTLRDGVPVDMTALGISKETFDAISSTTGSSGDIGADRRGGLGSGQRPVGEVQDPNIHHGTSPVIAGDAAASG